MSEGHSKTLLLGFYRRMKALREERAAIGLDLREVGKEARIAGFDSVKLTEVCLWMERVEKNGRAAMDEAEAVFDLYRGVVDGQGEDFDALMNDARDRALLKIFAPDDQVAAKVNNRVKGMNSAVIMAEAARRAREGS